MTKQSRLGKFTAWWQDCSFIHYRCGMAVTHAFPMWLGNNLILRWEFYSLRNVQHPIRLYFLWCQGPNNGVKPKPCLQHAYIQLIMHYQDLIRMINLSRVTCEWCIVYVICCNSRMMNLSDISYSSFNISFVYIWLSSSACEQPYEEVTVGVLGQKKTLKCAIHRLQEQFWETMVCLVL